MTTRPPPRRVDLYLSDQREGLNFAAIGRKRIVSRQRVSIAIKTELRRLARLAKLTKNKRKP